MADDSPRRRSKKFAYNRPFLYPEQLRAIFDAARWVAIEATTKAGKTIGCIIWILERAIAGKKDQNFWWIAPTKAVSKIAFGRFVAGVAPHLFTVNETERKVTLYNGTHIWFKGADDPDSLYGEDVWAAVIDEASRTKESSWHAVRSTLTATGGPARLIGNVKGRRNWFYKLARRAETGEPGWAYHKITWKHAVDAGIYPQSEIDDARRILPPVVFQELYEAEASEDGSNPFGLDAIRGCVIPDLSLEPIHCWGWDLAKYQDWTVGIALDRKGRMVKFVRFGAGQTGWREAKKRILAETAGKPALVDATGVGDAIVEDLQAAPGGNFEGYVFTSASKQILMEGLGVALQARAIGLTEGPLISELESFEFEYTARGVRYSAPEGMHDDCVCSLALAVRKLGPTAQPFVFSRVPRRDLGSIDAPDGQSLADTYSGPAPGSWRDRRSVTL